MCEEHSLQINRRFVPDKVKKQKKSSFMSS